MRVVCIYDDWDKLCQYHPVRGKVYTIKSAVSDYAANGFIYAGVYVELDGVRMPGAVQTFWRASFFKPLDETRLDVFRQHLTKAHSPRERVGV
jgi:hypothetical protein